MTTFARFFNTSTQHILVEGTKITLCGRDATLAYKYPTFKGNLNRTCPRCLDNRRSS